jgi:hypothetical protein
MDYESFDRGAVQYLASCVVNGTRFYLTGDWLATDIQDRARRFRWYGEADEASREARRDPAWCGRFEWTAVRRIMGGGILI